MLTETKNLLDIESIKLSVCKMQFTRHLEIINCVQYSLAIK